MFMSVAQIINQSTMAYGPRTPRVCVERWMRLDCHPQCLHNNYKWPAPSATSHNLDWYNPIPRFVPHSLQILAANAYRFRVGKEAMEKGPSALIAAQLETLIKLRVKELEEGKENKDPLKRLPAQRTKAMRMTVRIQTWYFDDDRCSPYFGHMLIFSRKGTTRRNLQKL